MPICQLRPLRCGRLAAERAASRLGTTLAQNSAAVFGCEITKRARLLDPGFFSSRADEVIK
jgi:hypothetical protein